MNRPQDEIVFEDLHGAPDTESVTVDLDVDSRDTGIERSQRVADDDPETEEQEYEFEDLRSADEDRREDLEDAGLVPSEDEEGDDGYSRKVKARVDRERRAKKKAQDEAAYWKQQAEQMAYSQSSHEKTELEATVTRTKEAITKAEVDLERAIEDGNTKEQVRLTGEMTNLKAEQILAETNLENLSSDVNLRPYDGNVQAQPDTQDQAKKVSEWVEGRADWYGQRGFERQTRLANRLDKEVFADGFDPNTDEYFEELDRRIKEKEPNLYDDEPAPRRKQRRSPVAPVSEAEPRQRQSGNKVELDESDFANMRRFNLDPNDPQVLKEYARNKAQTLGGRR